MTKAKRILIIGGGISGLSVAWHLERQNAPYRLFEREAEVGGVCRSGRLDGHLFDQGGHVLHFKDLRVAAFFKRLLGTNVVRQRRKSFYHAFGSYAPYPFQTHLKGMPDKVIRECLDGVREARRKAAGRDVSDVNFRTWALRTFGPGIARHFLLPYNEKFWTVPLRVLSARWCAGVVPAPTYAQILAGSRGGSVRPWGSNSFFFYPKEGGIQEVPFRLAETLDVRTNCRAVRIDLKRKIVEFDTGARLSYDLLVSTVPLPELGRMVRGLPGRVRGAFGRLRWNSIWNLYLRIDGGGLERRHWVYFPEKKVPFFRVSFPGALSGQDGGGLSVEVAHRPGRHPDRRTLSKKIVEEVRRVGLVPRGRSISILGDRDIVYGYPIEDVSCKSAKAVIRGFLEENDIISAGRYGSWRTMSIEDAWVEGRTVAERAAGFSKEA